MPSGHGPMTRTTISRNELILLGILALLTGLVGLVPWKKIVIQYSDYQARKYDFAHVITEPDKHLHSPSPWRTEARYTPETGALELQLSHKHNLPTTDLWVLAEFTPGKSHRPAAAALMRHRPGGVFRSDNLHLGKGEWVMSITGIQRSSFVFRKEQMLKVD